MIEIPVQINGVLWDVVEVPDDSEPHQMVEKAEQSTKVFSQLQRMAPMRPVVVPWKLVNFVPKDHPNKGVVYRLIEEQLPDGTYRKSISPKPTDWP